MLDIQFIRDNHQAVRDGLTAKQVTVDIDELLSLDSQRRQLLRQVEALRQQRNETAAQMKNGQPSPELIAEGRRLKQAVGELEANLQPIEAQFNNLLSQLPNLPAPDVPAGGEADSLELRRVGDCDKTGAIDHLDFVGKRDWVDFERGAKVAGAKFYFLKGDLALLEQAIIQFALNMVVEQGFTFLTVPHMVNAKTATGTGFAPRSSKQSDEYFIDGEDLSLIATAEMPLTGYHAGEIIEVADLPLKYVGLSPCYRKEAGTYGKHTRGLFRVHQFNKLEMYAFTTPEDSSRMHDEILALEESIWQAIGIPYRVVTIAAGDLGAPAAKKYDIEYWSPVDGAFRELTSCSNCTDFQTRNLDIRLRQADGSLDLVHSLNGTAVSMARTLVAVIEHFQTSDGQLTIPEVIRPFMGGRTSL